MEPLLTGNGSASPDTAARIRRVFVQSLHLNLSEQDFSFAQKLDESVGLDSIAVLDFVAALEKEFGIEFEVEMLTIDLIRDLPQLAAYVDERLARPRPAEPGA